MKHKTKKPHKPTQYDDTELRELIALQAEMGLFLFDLMHEIADFACIPSEVLDELRIKALERVLRGKDQMRSEIAREIASRN